MAGGAGSLNVGAAAGATLGAGGAASNYFTGDYYLVSTNLLLDADVSSFVIPTDAWVPLLAYFLLISSCLTSSVIVVTGVMVMISGMIMSGLLSILLIILVSSSFVRSLLHVRD